MLLRLRVKGFKNLLDNDIFFGPFTCIAGVNGVGKSNLFDALEFLSMLARQKSLLEAAAAIRGDSARGSDYRQIFSHYGADYGEEIVFVADLLVPKEATDEYGQKATASFTLLRYSLRLRNRGEHPSGPIEIVEEDLRALPSRDFSNSARFYSNAQWRSSVLQGRYKRVALISTEEGKVKLHQDQKTGGKAQPFVASDLPRTVLSRTITSESPTGLCARREMESWTFLQLEPNALRKPSPFTAPRTMGANGDNLPAVIARLGEARYQELANTLFDLNQDVRTVRIDKNEVRQHFELLVKTGRTEYPARALSDGTLRFLALAVLSQDPQFTGMLCMEEPENGIHPERLSAMVKLLQDVAVDCEEPVGDDNPLRQVIINTHSPTLVSLVSNDSLMMAQTVNVSRGDESIPGVSFAGLDGTWREGVDGTQSVSKGLVLSYLNPAIPVIEPSNDPKGKQSEKGGRKRVADWACEQMSMWPAAAEERPEYGKDH